MKQPSANNLQNIRHSLAHLLAKAVLEIYPQAKLTLGPAVDDGFYYDIDFDDQNCGEEVLPKLEKKMREILQHWKSSVFTRTEISPTEAKTLFKNNPYKLELIEEIIKKQEPITIYSVGEGQYRFDDLCRGGHVDSIKDLQPDAFKLDRVAGAYWRGDEKNKMLTRIYGLAFNSKKELDEYLIKREEAKKRDHKILGPKLDLFTFSELVGPGLPLWTPKGTLLRFLLDDFVWQLRKRAGYVRVEIPHMTKKDLYEKSGHWAKYSEELFRITTREGHYFALKPMNCPHHIQIYARKQWSYRELPQRYANTTMCYRDEQTGELSGLSRVRAFTQDDAHVFCRMTQVEEEFLKIWDIVHEFYSAFGFTIQARLSLHDPQHPEKFLGDKTKWRQAEGILRAIVKTKTNQYFEGIGEAAFYGPKLDFMAKDSLGREWQVATIQLDMNMPERFNLVCINEDGKAEPIVMIHAAIMGSIERFLSILIEHTAGKFPLWLAPVQIVIIPVSDKFNNYAKDLGAKLGSTFRVEVNDRNESVGKKIREAEIQKIPYILVVGEKEQSLGNLTVRKRGDTHQTTEQLESFTARLQTEIEQKS